MSARIPEEIRANADFQYVNDLPDHQKRMATFYEFCRESERHKSVIAECRRTRLFEEGRGQLGPEIRALPMDNDIFPVPIMMFLARCKSFPKKPFHQALKDPQIQGHLYANSKAEGSLPLPWDVLLAFRDNDVKAGRAELEYFLKPRGTKTLHAIMIPWNYTNKELVGIFRAIIPGLRPAEFPEPQRAGRAGRAFGKGAVDMLRQLSAMRLARADIDFASGGTLAQYVSLKGWKQGIMEAQRRIDTMAEVPLFASRKQRRK